MIKYRTWLGQIEAKEVIRETEEFVVLSCSSGSRKEIKRSRYTNWHDSWQEAKNFLVDEAQAEISRIKLSLDINEKILANIKELKDPID